MIMNMTLHAGSFMRRPNLTSSRTTFWVASALLGAMCGTALDAQGAVKRWVLVYAGGPHRPAYTVDDLIHVLAVVDSADRVTGRLCDGVLFLEYQTVSGRNYVPVPNGIPSTDDDWTIYLDSLFALRGPVERLDSAAKLVGLGTGTPDRSVAVAVMVPYPDPRADTLRFGKRLFSLRSDSGRAGIAFAYMRDVKRRFLAKRLSHVSLTTFYWMYEGIYPVDTALVSRVTADAHSQGFQFLWIPSYRAAGWDRWKSLGFDQAWLQPNYFFHPEVPTTRLDSALVLARGAGMGLELEFDRRMFEPGPFADRLEPYLNIFENAPDLRGEPIAIYDGAGALIRLARSKDEWHRALYDRLVAVLRVP